MEWFITQNGKTERGKMLLVLSVWLICEIAR